MRSTLIGQSLVARFTGGRCRKLHRARNDDDGNQPSFLTIGDALQPLPVAFLDVGAAIPQ